MEIVGDTSDKFGSLVVDLGGLHVNRAVNAKLGGQMELQRKRGLSGAQGRSATDNHAT
jgi:hypothetical protein